MPARLVSPEFSFVDFNQVPPAECCEGDNAVCLPVLEEADLAFQFKILTTNTSEADTIMAMPLTSFQFVLLRGTGNISLPFFTNLVRNWTTSDALVFERFRTGVTEMTFVWRQNLKNIKTLLACDECFELGIYIPGIELGGPPQDIFSISNCFKLVCSSCWTSLLEYGNTDNSFDFTYCNVDFTNKARLRMHLANASYPDDRSIYFKSNGRPIVTRAIYKKEYELLTDYYPEFFHDKIKIALDHDLINITAAKYAGEISRSAAYDPDFIDDMCTGLAKSKVLAIGAYAQNNNCVDCGNLECPEIEELTHNVIYNYPAGDQNFTFTFTPISTSESPNILVQYRLSGTSIWTESPQVNMQPLIVTLPLGVYDFRLAASNDNCLRVFTPIIESIGNAEAPSCQMPTALSITPDNETALVGWHKVSPTPAGGYEWEVVDHPEIDGIEDSLGSNILLTLSGLTPGTEYTFRVRTVCGEGDFSEWVSMDFTTTEPVAPGNITMECNISTQDPIEFGVAGMYTFYGMTIVVNTPGSVTLTARNDQAGSLSGYSMYYQQIVTVVPGQTTLNFQVQYDGGGVHSIFEMFFSVTDLSGTQTCDGGFFSFN